MTTHPGPFKRFLFSVSVAYAIFIHYSIMWNLFLILRFQHYTATFITIFIFRLFMHLFASILVLRSVDAAKLFLISLDLLKVNLGLDWLVLLV